MNTITKNIFKPPISDTIIRLCLLSISLSCFYIGLFRLYLGAPDLSQSIDNSMRFYAGGLTAIGFLSTWAVFKNKLQNILIFFFAFFVFMSGFGRLISIISVGIPNHTYLFYLTIEFLIPLIMIIAQIKSNKK